MLDEKTTGPEQQAAPQTAQKRSLRSLWAQLQCVHLLRRHRFRRKTQRRMNNVRQKMRATPLVQAVGEFLYALGFAAEYAAVRAGRNVAHAALWAAGCCKKFAHDLAVTAFPGAVQMFKDLFGPIVLFFKGIGALLVHAHRIHKEQGLGAALKASARFFTSGIRRNLKLLPRMAMYILPLCALALYVTVFESVVHRPYALAVQVNGQTVGYVANEATFNLAREDVQERIHYAGTDKTEWTIEPTYTISTAHQVMDENQMANAILRSASDEISEGTALYLDGELTAVCADGTSLQSYINGLLLPYEDEGNANVTVGFNRAVDLEQGIYFNESFQDLTDIENTLSGVQQAEKIYKVQAGDTLWAIAQKNDLTFKELCALNTNFKGAPLTETSNIQEGDELIVTKEEAMLEVRITKIEVKQEEIPYTTETTNSNELTKGTTKVTQEGENGLRNVTLQNVYDANGALLEQTVLSTEIIKEAVPKKVTVGTKKVTSSTKYITGSGKFIWPVPNYKYCSRWYSSGHKGVDICAPAGTPIYATASGTVAKAGYNKAGAGTGYGYSVVVNHGGGYTSVYAHCLSLAVHAGQSVKQGQLIGYVGSTGRSSGNHCHFEIRLNGSYVPPQKIFPGKR
ncbi:MAG: M23 family metallopeptidase [Ruminococcaceae bacterium]|nr:M23 family metallopeptidase [Oscillospiraceae bacterium]